MSVWIVSMVLQWIVIALLCLLVLSLVRQIGSMSLSLNALRDAGTVRLHTRLPLHRFRLLDGTERVIGGAQERASLIVFFSPSCDACEALPGAIEAFASNGMATELDLLGVISASPDDARRFVQEKSIRSANIATADDFPEHFIPRQGVPYAVAITAGGAVAAVGKPKTLTHLREMALAATKTMDLATTHSVRSHEWGDSAPYWELPAN